MRGSGTKNRLFLLQLAVGLFFLLTGILGLIDYDSTLSQMGRGFGRMFGNNTQIIQLAIFIVYVISGVILVGSLFISIDARYFFVACLAIMIIWGIKMVVAFILNDFLKPNFIQWLLPLSHDLIILTALWSVSDN
jgi:hypothetical protein